MKAIISTAYLIGLFLCLNTISAQEQLSTKKVAITFDDLPITGYSEGQSTYAEAQYITRNILKHLHGYQDKSGNFPSASFIYHKY